MNFLGNLDWYLIAQEDSRVFYQWMRIEQMDQWIHWFVFACCVGLVVSYVVYWYRRDWHEVPKGVGWTLLLLRLAALLGILVFFLDLQKRTEQRVTRPSKLAILVDTSLSMTMPENDETSEPGSPAAASRIASVQNAFAKSPMLEQLRQRHDTIVYRFDQNSRPTAVASFIKPKDAMSDQKQLDNNLQLWRLLSRVAWFGTIVVIISAIVLTVALIARTARNAQSFWPYVIMFSVIGVIAGFTFLATAILRADQFAWNTLWSWTAPDASQSTGANATGTATTATDIQTPANVAWETALAASGTESRVGDAIASILEQERGSPLAGIVVISDGRSNAGIDPLATISDASMQSVPVFTVGLGTAKNPINVRLLDVEAPKRVFPGDRFRMTAVLQASGLQGKQVTVQLRRRAGGQKNSGMAIEEERTVTLEAEDALSNLSFDIKPREIGVWVYEVKLIPPVQDTNPIDNALEAEVRVVEPKSTVLIIAGGPTREYQFVRNLLFRDPTVQSHVYLQSGGAGVSQEAKKLLTEFPKTRAEMSLYDCVISFDTDWTALSSEQIEVMEKWISEQSGGLVLVAGPVSTPKWAGSLGNGNRKAEIIRNLCPLVVNTRGAQLVSIGRFESETAWQLQFANEAWRTDFVQIASTVEASQKAWSDFRGVYSFYSCYEPKPGATPLAYFSDPTTSVNGAQPIYLATQFYGSGRVAFQGGGEFWRLREVGEGFFDTYYTKLTRWAGAGRLLRDSDRGVLLLDKQQAMVGESVTVRAVLKDAQFQPTILPEVTAKLLEPSGMSTPLVLRPIPDASQPGVYIGQFFVRRTGNYEVQLPVGGLSDQQLLTQQVTVRVPALEIQRPQRNDVLLSELATRTGGKYWVGMNEAAGLGSGTSSTTVVDGTIVSAVVPRDQVNYLPGAPDRDFQQRLMGLLMAFIAGALSLEWLIRRLSKLA